ncbi:hypothetical protein BDQ94DRAFT_134754 [Aspergillus welwitschiae]|uniref:Uncharacterized protein n=1 Tax=Aspergillus welwitschiae TaxID=1341132 RepID=A0A3F3QIS1_9EURO|nr:hypothetical protein BDQ94DRAFT_134754 [Aspergillus welwitschiae]RDH38849.1 hypothetical protein BDQ94DRAFT_134754 [Aspergillus welwitschiae]
MAYCPPDFSTCLSFPGISKMDLQETRSPNSGQWVPLINHQTHATIHASGRSSRCQLIIVQLFIQQSGGEFKKLQEAALNGHLQMPEKDNAYQPDKSPSGL